MFMIMKMNHAVRKERKKIFSVQIYKDQFLCGENSDNNKDNKNNDSNQKPKKI